MRMRAFDVYRPILQFSSRVFFTCTFVAKGFKLGLSTGNFGTQFGFLFSKQPKILEEGKISFPEELILCLSKFGSLENRYNENIKK